MTSDPFNTRLLDFLRRSPTPFHAVATMREALDDGGFRALNEAQSWALEPGGRYYVVRNDSSIVAFRLGEEAPVETGLRMIGAHTDSPCLKLKPNAVKEASGYVQFGVEVYGGVLLNPWFDRDLSLAGRVTVRVPGGEILNVLVDFETPVAVIPSLAIHLDREANDSRSINKQTMLPPLLGLAGGEPFDLHQALIERLVSADAALAKAAILDSELMLYDTQPPAIVGLGGEFIAGARLDNLLSCHAGLEAITGSKADTGQLLVCNDHEEVGSGSAAGARGNLLRSVLERIAGSGEDFARMIARSMLVSTDNAHGVHPNFADRHDEQHGPLLNAGPVLKVNSNQSYASNSESLALLRAAAMGADVPLQSFVTRTDLGCGSTIGPLTATAIGVRTVDVGVPTFAMHSVRELAGRDDARSLWRLLDAFLRVQDLSVTPAVKR